MKSRIIKVVAVLAAAAAVAGIVNPVASATKGDRKSVV